MDAAQMPPPPDGAAAGESSLTDRLTDVIAAPREVFEEIKGKPVRTTNWLVPLILSCIGSVIYIWLAFSEPSILRDMQEKREHSLQRSVASGKMTKAQADQATTAMERFVTPGFMALFGSVSAVAGSIAGLFLFALAIWFALKSLGTPAIDYMKVVETCGLALVIDVPQKIVRIALVAWKGNLLATASPVLFVANPSTSNKVHLVLSMFDVVDFWWLAVLSLGISKVASVRYRTAAFIAFGIWYAFRLLAVLLTPSQ